MQTDLISRSAVLDILSDEFDMAAEERAEADNEKDRAFNAGEINCARRSTRKVKELPAIDAVPVVHARWIDPCINKYGHPCHHCSACRFKASQKDRNYCPNFGALSATSLTITRLPNHTYPQLTITNLSPQYHDVPSLPNQYSTRPSYPEHA